MAKSYLIKHQPFIITIADSKGGGHYRRFFGWTTFGDEFFIGWTQVNSSFFWLLATFFSTRESRRFYPSSLNLLKQQNCKHFSSSSIQQRKWEILSHSMDSHFTHFSNRFRKRSWTIIFASFCVSRTDAASSTPRHTSFKLLCRLFSK